MANVVKTSVLVVTGGHPFDAPAFFDIFAANSDISWTASTHPEVGFDVVVFYDLPGITFTGQDPPAKLHSPSPPECATLAALQERGTGLVFLHHAIAGWPMWEEYATLIGGRFHYQPGWMAGRHYPDSGYITDITHTIEVLDPHHPVCDGVDSSFTLHDELYCFPVLESHVLPLMRTTFPVHEAHRFASADAAIRGRPNPDWNHPPGSSLIAWAKAAQRSPLVYLQFGDGPTAFANPTFRKIIGNAITWTASLSARQWADTWVP